MTKKKKSEVMDCGGGEKGVEHWVMKRQRMRTKKEEEGQKKKRTVFVGNLPISCTKKVRRELCNVTASGVQISALLFSPTCSRVLCLSDSAEPVQG